MKKTSRSSSSGSSSRNRSSTDYDQDAGTVVTALAGTATDISTLPSSFENRIFDGANEEDRKILLMLFALEIPVQFKDRKDSDFYEEPLYQFIRPERAAWSMYRGYYQEVLFRLIPRNPE